MHEISIEGYIPVSPALLRFVEWRDAIPSGQVIEVPSRTGIAALLEGMIQWLLIFHDEFGPAEPPSVQCDRYSARLHFRLKGPSLARHEVFFYADRLCVQLNKILYQEAHAEILRQVLTGKAAKTQEKDTIDQFLRKTGMDDFWDFDAVKKAQYRARTDRGGLRVNGYEWALAAANEQSVLS